MRTTPQLVRAALEAFETERWEELMSLLDPSFEVSSFFAPGKILRGPEEVVRTLQQARGTVYSIDVERCEPMDTRTALGVGNVRAPMPRGGFKHHGAAWLWTSDDGRLTTWFSFETEEVARQSYAGGVARSPDQVASAPGHEWTNNRSVSRKAVAIVGSSTRRDRSGRDKT